MSKLYVLASINKYKNVHFVLVNVLIPTYKHEARLVHEQTKKIIKKLPEQFEFVIFDKPSLFLSLPRLTAVSEC